MKEYPLQIETLHDCDNSDLVSYYSKGHHDPSLFAEAVMEDYGDEIKPEKVKHEHRRWEIVCGAEAYRSLNPPRSGTTRRGVFPVTIVEW